MPLMAFFFLIAFCSAYGQGKNFFIDRKDPSWIIKKDSKGATPPAKDISDGYFLSFYENQNNVELQEDYSHTIREIVSDAGVQNGSEISVTYEPGFQKLIFHKIILWRNNQPSDQLKASKFKVLQKEKDLSKFIYSGTFNAYLLLDDVRKGDRIEYAYTIKGYNPAFGQKYATGLYFESSSSIGHSYTNVIVNKNRTLQFKNFNFNEAPKITEKDGLKMYEWESKLTKTYRTADYEPSWYNPFKRTQLTEYKNWNEVVNWGLAINDYPVENTGLLVSKAQELKQKSGNNPKKYIELATRFVQDEIRYMGIETGQYSHKPNSPEKVLRQRYGDCKDKSLLLVHLLNQMNINAYMAYVDTYTRIKTIEELPSPFAFNHVVVVAEMNNHKIWIDPTISYQRGPIDRLYFPDYGQALVIKKGVNALENVISNPKGKLKSNLTFTLSSPDSNKNTVLIVKSVYTDNYADNIRATIAESGTDDLEKQYLEYYTKSYTGIEITAPIEIKDNESTNTLEITESYEISDIWDGQTDAGKPYASFYADLISPRLRKIPAKARIAPLSLGAPINIDQTITIHLPMYWDLDAAPFKLENEALYFETKASQKDKTIVLNYVLRNKTTYIDGANVKTYIKDREKILDQLGYYITWGAPSNQDAFNPYLICISMLILMVCFVYVLNLYQVSTPFDLDKISNARPIRGWLILLGLDTICNPIASINVVTSYDIWKYNTWKGFNQYGVLAQYSLKTMIIIYVALFSVLFCLSILNIFLFFKRRESYVQRGIQYLFGYICLVILCMGIYLLLKGASGEPIIWKEITTMLLSIVYSSIWISYLKRSTRVEETFVFTYPELAWKTELIKKETLENENV